MPGRRSWFVALVVATAIPGVAAPTGAGGDGVRRDVFYQSSATEEATLTLVPLADGRDGGTLVKVRAEFRCDDQDVTGALLVSVGTDGRFSEDTNVFTSDADIGSETDVTIAGRMGSKRARGTIDAYVRAYDEEGTTFECERTLRWRAAARAAAQLERIEAFARVGAADSIAAGGDAVYLGEERGDSKDVVRRIDPSTGDIWRRRVEAASDLAAGRDALWTASGFVGRVEGFAADDGASIEGIDVDDGFDAITGIAPLAVSSDAVWLALAPGRLVRLDPESGEVLADFGIGEVTGSELSVGLGPSGVVVAIEEPREDGGELPLRVLRVDPATNAVVTDVRRTGQVTAVAAGQEVVTIGSFFDPILRLDATSLEPLATSDLVASEVVALGSLTWLATAGSVVALDAAGAVVVELPGITGALATDGERVWVLDHAAGAVIGLSGAEPDE